MEVTSLLTNNPGGSSASNNLQVWSDSSVLAHVDALTLPVGEGLSTYSTTEWLDPCMLVQVN